MKTRDTILVILGSFAILVFVGIMFDYYIKTQENEIKKKNVYYDSLLLQEQTILKRKDSIIVNDGGQLRNRINNHEYRIRQIEKTIQTFEKTEKN